MPDSHSLRNIGRRLHPITEKHRCQGNSPGCLHEYRHDPDKKNDTLSFSTLNADRTGLNGLLIGDTVEISYAGKYAPGMSAVKIAADKK